MTAANPFTPLEIIFAEPPCRPSLSRLLEACALSRPHYLDKDLLFQYATPGNRALLLTLLSKKPRLFFHGEMQRQILWWTENQLPSLKKLRTCEEFDGIFIPDTHDFALVGSWQKKTAPFAEDLPAITFSSASLQRHWIRMTQADEYWMDIL